MSSASVPVLYAGSTRLYPRPYVPRPPPSKQDQKASQQSISPFADLDRLLSGATASLHQEGLPSHRWERNAIASPSGTPHSILLAQQSLVAIVFANRLQVFNTTTSTRLFEFVFESENGENKWPVTDVVECSLQSQSDALESAISPHTILVSVMTGANEGRIYLIDYLSARTLIYVHVPFSVTKMLPVMCPTESSPKDQGIVVEDGLLSKFKEPLLIGTRGGVLVALDLHFDHSTLENENLAEHFSAELRHSLGNYDREGWLAEQSNALTHPWLDLSAPFEGRTGEAQGLFFYLNPSPGEFFGHIDTAEPVPRESVTITSLQLLWPAPTGALPKPAASTMYVDGIEDLSESDPISDSRMPSNWIPGLSTPLFVVGYNFGTFQIWSLDTMELLYCSPITESRATVTSFEVQSLHNMVDTPSENKVLLWVSRGSISTTHTQQAHPPSISAYSISLIKRSAAGELLGASHPPLAISDCLASVVSECSSNLPSTFEDEYYGQVRLMQVLPCWESDALNNSSIAFVYETFPLRPTASSKSPKSLECFILSTSSLQVESDRLFAHPDQLLQLSMPYQLSPISNDPSMLLSFNINPSSLQHYFPRITGASKMSNSAVSRAHVSFDSIAITEDSIWKIGYSSFGQQLLNVLSEQGPVVFDRPELLAPLLHHLDRSVPTSEEEAHSLRDELFSLALHNNLATVVSDYVLDSTAGSALASLSLTNTSASHASLHHVLSWSRTNFHRILDTANALIDDYLADPEAALTTPAEKANFVLELRQAKRLLNDLYNVVKALIVKYQTQRQKWGAQEDAMQQDLSQISLGTQFIDCCLWFVQNPVDLTLDVILHKTQIRRTRSVDCAKNSPTAWDVAFDSKTAHVLSSAGTEATRLTVTPKPFNASTDGCLLIEHLVAQIAASNEDLHTMSYPPTSLESIVHWTKNGDPIFIAQKHQVMYYMLLEVSEDLATQFANRMLLTPAEQKLVKGLHLIDSNNYDEAMPYINHTQVIDIISDDLALKILRVLNDARAFPHALSFYRLRQPPLDSLASVVLLLYVYLSNGLISEAFFMVRGQSRTTLDSFDPLYLHTLFFHFLHHLYNNHILKDVFQLPFDPIESEAVKQYLLWSQDTSKAIDMHLVFLLQRSRIADAVNWYHEQNQAHTSGDRDNELMKAHLINNYIRVLPPIIRSTLKRATTVPSASSHSLASQPTKSAAAAQLKSGTSAASSTSSIMTPSKKIVSKLFSNAQPQSQPKNNISSTSRFVPASLGPALLSPTNPGRFARSPAIFRPTVVLSTSSNITETKAQENTAASLPPLRAESASPVPRQSLFYDKDIGTNLISTPAKKLFATNKSVISTGTSTPVHSTTITPPVQPTATIVSQDSLIDIDSDDELIVEFPTAPISTPTKKVMDSVRMQSNDVRRQSQAIADVRYYRDDDDREEDPDDMVLIDDEDDGEEEEEDDDNHHGMYLEESDIDDEALEKIRGQSDDEDQDLVEEHSEAAMDESVSRTSRRSAASARSRLSGYARSTRSAASRTSSNQAPSSRASSKTPAQRKAGRRAVPALQTVAEEGHSSQEATPRSKHKQTPAADTGSQRSRRSTRSNTSHASTVVEEPHISSRRSSRLAGSKLPVHAEESMELSSAMDQEPTELHPRRSSRVKPSGPAATTDETVDPHPTDVSTSSILPSNSRRSSRLLSKQTSSTAPNVDIPVEPLGVHSEAAEAAAEDSDSDDMSTDTIRVRRSSRSTKGQTIAPTTPAAKPSSGRTTSQSSVSSRTRSIKLKERQK